MAISIDKLNSPITQTATMIVTTIGACFWLSGRFHDFDTAFLTMNNRMQKIEERMADKSMEDRIRAWIALDAAMNQNLKHPEFH